MSDLKNKPDHKSKKLLERAIALQEGGNLQKATTYYRRYLKHDPHNAVVLHTLSGLCYQNQDLHAAGEYLEKAHQADPHNLDYQIDLGALQTMIGNHQSAIVNLTKLIEQNSEIPQAYYNLGLALHAADSLSEAIAAFEQAIKLQPDYAAAHYNLGVTFQDIGHFDQARESYQKAIHIQPYLVQAHFKLGEIFTHQIRNDAAYEAFLQAYKLDKKSPKIAIRLAESFHNIGRTEDGISLLKDMLDKYPEMISLMSILGRLLHIAGEIEAAEEIYMKALMQKQYVAEACSGFSQIRKFNNRDSKIINQMEEMLESHELKGSEQIYIRFALGKIYDDCKEYTKAFIHYSAGNAIQHERFGYDREAHKKYIDDIISVFTKEFFDEFSGLGTNEERPIFILGIPRSGTSLVEQIIASHPQVAGAGELNYFRTLSGQLSRMLDTELTYPQCCNELDKKIIDEITRHYFELLSRHSKTARFVTDKMPHNYLHIGLIHLLFPKASIILCCRDPLDVCLSIFFQYFDNSHKYACDLMDIGHHYLQYARLMAHWRKTLSGKFMECQYEELIINQEARSKELIEFCGLDWDKYCLTFYKAKRDVKTASNWQVRQPIYDSSIRRWKNYENYLEQLKNLLECDNK